MNIENRLRDALEAERASGAEATPQMWASVRERAKGNRARRRAQQLVVIGLSAAALVAVIVGVMLGGGERERREGITDVPPVTGGGRPAYLVSLEDGRIVVRSSTDGRHVRELMPDASSVSKIVTSGDGAQVYVSRMGSRDCAGTSKPQTEIVRVPIAGGPMEHVAWGFAPTIARGTGDLFYIAATCDESESLRRLAPGTDEPGALVEVGGFDGASLMPYAATADGSKLLADRIDGQGAVVLRLGENVELSPVEFPFPADEGSRALTFVGEDKVVGAINDGNLSKVQTFDPSDGSDREHLFAVGRATRVTSDDAGENFIVARGNNDSDDVERWNSDEEFVDIEDWLVGQLAWARGPLAAPKHFAAVTPDGELQIRETATGDVVKSVRNLDMSSGPPRLAPTPDGRFIYVDKQGRRIFCSEGQPGSQQEITRIRTSDGGLEVAAQSQPEVVARGAEPAVSPDGKKLAYVTDVGHGRSTTACGRNTILVIRDLATGEETALDSEHEELQYEVTSPHWSPDSGSVLFTLVGEGEGLATAHGVLDLDDPQVSELPLFDMMTLESSPYVGGFLEGNEVLAFEAPEDAMEIVTYNTPTPPAEGFGPTAERTPGTRRRFIASQPGVTSPISLQAVDGEHILYTLRDPSARSESEPNTAFRYSIGDLQTRMIASDVVSVAWFRGAVPGAAEPRSTAQPTPSLSASAAPATDCSTLEYQPTYLPEAFFDPEPEFPESKYSWHIRFRNDSMTVEVIGGYYIQWGDVSTENVAVGSYDARLGNPTGEEGHLAVAWHEPAGTDCEVGYAVVAEGVGEEELLRVANSLGVSRSIN